MAFWVEGHATYDALDINCSWLAMTTVSVQGLHTHIHIHTHTTGTPRPAPPPANPRLRFRARATINQGRKHSISQPPGTAPAGAPPCWLSACHTVTHTQCTHVRQRHPRTGVVGGCSVLVFEVGSWLVRRSGTLFVFCGCNTCEWSLEGVGVHGVMINRRFVCIGIPLYERHSPHPLCLLVSPTAIDVNGEA